MKKMDLNDHVTYERLCEIDKDEEVKRFLMMEDYAHQMTPEQLKHWIDGHADKIVLGVFGVEKQVGGAEAGKLQGEIFVESDVPGRIEEMRVAGTIPFGYEDVNCVEIGYARYPKAMTHQMSSGVRSLAKLMAKVYEGEKVYLLGYVEKDNLRSDEVLKAAGFTFLGEVVYDKNVTAEKDRVYGREVG